MTNPEENAPDRTLDNFDLTKVKEDTRKRLRAQKVELELTESAMALIEEAIERREKKKDDKADKKDVTKGPFTGITDDMLAIMLFGALGCVYPDNKLENAGPVLEAISGSKCEQSKRRRVEDDA